MCLENNCKQHILNHLFQTINQNQRKSLKVTKLTNI